MAAKKSTKATKSAPKKKKMVLTKGLDLIGAVLNLETPTTSK